MELTAPRRSQLLQALLAKQIQPRQDIINPGQLAAELGAQYIRKKQIDKLSEEEAAQQKTTRANEAAVLAKVMGEGDVDFQGRPITDASGKQQSNISLAQALGQLGSDNPVGAAVASKVIEQSFAGKAEPENPFGSLNPKDFTPESVDKFEDTVASGRADYGVLRAIPKEPLVEMNNVPPGVSSIFDERVSHVFADTKGLQEAAVKDSAQATAARTAIGLIDEGIFSGVLQPVTDMFAKAVGIFSDENVSGEGVQEMMETLRRSEEFDSETGILVGSIIRLFGSGTGLSDADREFARQISGAIRNRREDSLRNILQRRVDSAESSIKNYNRVVDGLEGSLSDIQVRFPRIDTKPKTAEDYLKETSL